MYDALVPENTLCLAEVIANVGLFAYPVEVPADSLRQIDLRFVTSRGDAFGIAGQVPHLAGTKFTLGFRRNPNPQRFGYVFGDFANGNAAAAAHVYRKSVQLIGFRREK